MTSSFCHIEVIIKMQPSPAILMADGMCQALWWLILPFLRNHYRLVQAFDQRCLKNVHFHRAGLWIQSASAGEAYLAWEILKKLPGDRPLRVLVTTNTSQGLGILEQAKKALVQSHPFLELQCAYFPFDSPAIMQRALKMVRPRLMVLLETELWPALMAGLKRQNSQIAVLNARMARRSLKRYMLWPAYWHSRRPNHILAISKQDRTHYENLFGRQDLGTMSNIKFDRLEEDDTRNEPQIEIQQNTYLSDNFIILGSIRMPEEAQVTRIVQRILSRRPDVVIGLFPRHMHRIAYWQRALQGLGIEWVQRSTKQSLKSGGVILWDVFGELGNAYLSAKAAFVGGSLTPLGGQNFLEPLVKGVPTVIGPHWDNFKWVGSQIIRTGILHQAATWQDVADFMLARIVNPVVKETLKKEAQDYIRTRQGGAHQAGELIMGILEGT